jgi:hypothetical protein
MYKFLIKKPPIKINIKASHAPPFTRYNSTNFQKILYKVLAILSGHISSLTDTRNRTLSHSSPPTIESLDSRIFVSIIN